VTFPLAGLLRVRGAQERMAAERLSHASSRRVEADEAAQHAATSLSELGSDAIDGPTLMAMAAARSAGRSALSDLQALSQLRQGEEAQAKAQHIDARRELRGLERLEAADRVETVKRQQDAEQNALDEIAGVRAARREGSAA
jgi:flagellar FliJ protein